MLKSKIRLLKQKETKKGKHHSDESLNNSAAPSPMEVLSPPDGAETKEDTVALEASQEGQHAAEGKKKRKVSKKKDDNKDEGEKVCKIFFVGNLHLTLQPTTSDYSSKTFKTESARTSSIYWRKLCTKIIYTLLQAFVLLLQISYQKKSFLTTRNIENKFRSSTEFH